MQQKGHKHLTTKMLFSKKQRKRIKRTFERVKKDTIHTVKALEHSGRVLNKFTTPIAQSTVQSFTPKRFPERERRERPKRILRDKDDYLDLRPGSKRQRRRVDWNNLGLR